MAWVHRLDLLKVLDVPGYRALANSLSDETFRELSGFYSNAVLENELKSLDSWFATLDRTVPMCDEEVGTRNMLNLFIFVAKVWDQQPFTSQKLGALVTPAIPDWNLLPNELRFLAGPATQFSKYSYMFSESAREKFQRNISVAEMSELETAAAKVRSIGFMAVKKWCSGLVPLRIEASMVFNLLACLDAAGVDYYSVDDLKRENGGGR